MAPVRDLTSEQPSYALEVHIRGVMHLQVERLPPRVTTVLTAVVSSLVTWLTTHGLHW
jgi:hypothetical protein